MSDEIHVFIYSGGPGADAEHEKVRDETVQGTLFDVEGIGAALMLSGHATVTGEVRRVAATALGQMDARARVREGLYRRVGVQIGETPCWAWVAGPTLAPRLASSRRGRGGESS